MVDKIITPPTTSELIGKVNELVDDKQDTLVSGTNIKTINNTSILGSGNIDIQGGSSYTAGTGININNDVISVTNDISAGAALGATALQSGDNISELVNNSGYITSSALSGYATQVWVGQQGYITGITSSDVTTALGYTPYNSTNPNGYITSSALTPYALSVDLASVATSGSYNDLSNKPTIPTVNNPTITFTQGGTTKGTITLNQSTNQTVAFDAGGSARNIGEIIQSTIPLTDAGLHLLDGSVISGDGIYSDFVDFIKNLHQQDPNGSWITDETGWQNSVNTYGVCGKFAIDYPNNTVRLPKITGFIEGTNDLTALGDLIQAGLPNITGTVGGLLYNGAGSNGAFSASHYERFGNGGSENNRGKATFNASNSNSIYGNSTTVQPQAIKILYYIVIATSTKTDIEVDIDQIATDLNGKADTDLSNCTKPYITETYVNGTSWYRVYSDGWCEQGGGDITTSGNVNFLKPFINTNYCLVGSIGHGDKSQTWEHYDLRKESTNYFYQDCCFDGYRLVSWYACGYIS